MSFTPDARNRIKDTVVYVERLVQNEPPRSPRQASGSSLGFWAELTSRGSGSNAYKYGWKALEPQTNGDMDEQHQWGFGSDTDNNHAISSDKTKWALIGDVVWLKPSKNQEYLIFDYAPGVRTCKLISADTITARSGATPGEGTPTFEKFDGTVFSDGENIKVYNSFRIAITGEPGGTLYMHAAYGEAHWWIVSVECEDDTGSPP